jgi:uncharacterized protein YgbK (DUF1537 family)
MSYFAIVADDLTGASDTGIKLSKQGYETDVVFNPENIEYLLRNSNILAVNSSTREDLPEIAYEKVYKITQILKMYGFKKVYKKIDSVLRGNVGVELDAVMKSFNISKTFLIPAIPLNGRTIVDGYLYINNGIKDVLYVPDIIEKSTDIKVEKIVKNDISKGKEYIIEKIKKMASNIDGNIVILFDTEFEDDFNKISEALKDYDEEFLLAGASGMASYLPDIWDMDETKNIRDKVKVGKSHLVIAGSYNNVTSEQIKTLVSSKNCAILPIETEKINEYENYGIVELYKDINSLVSKESDVMIVAVDTLLDENVEFKKENGPKITELLSKIAFSIIASGYCKTLTITGGETAYQVMKSLGAYGMSLTDEILPGMPMGTIIGGAADSFPLATKSGGFGEKDAFIKVIEYFEGFGKVV